MLKEKEVHAEARRYVNAVAEITRGPEGRPVRTIHCRGKRKPIGRYPSYKNARAHTWESVHERQLMWLCEADPDVVSYLEQPHRVTMPLLDRSTTARDLEYFPDLLCERADGSQEIIEVKKDWDEIRNDPAYEAKLEFVREIYDAKGYKFRILTASDDIEIEPFLSNARTIQSYRFTQVDTLDELRFHEALDAAGGSLTLGEAIEAVSASRDRFDPLAFALVCALIVRRAAFVDIRQVFDHGTELRRLADLRN
ncbi:Tn7 transposase TnsA N-terminal domain-containing protein [Nitrobacteraceae bacterium UC4446_H13]|jgi:hypothetical protein